MFDLFSTTIKHRNDIVVLNCCQVTNLCFEGELLPLFVIDNSMKTSVHHTVTRVIDKQKSLLSKLIVLHHLGAKSAKSFVDLEIARVKHLANIIETHLFKTHSHNLEVLRRL